MTKQFKPTRRARHASQAGRRAPLERLIDIGLRLHERRSAAELHEFLTDEVAGLGGAGRVLLVLDAPEGLHLAGALLPKGEWAPALLKAVTPWLEASRLDRAVHLRHGPDGAAEVDQRSCLVAPLVAQNKLLGFLYADIEGAFGRFDDADRDLLGMLAAQAAVALDNAQWAQGLERKVAERTRDLADALGQQTAMSDVLKVISRSTFDLDVVLQTLAENATRLCAADFGVFFRPDGAGNFPTVAHYNMPPAFLAALAAQPIRAGDGSLSGRVALEKRATDGGPAHRARLSARSGRCGDFPHYVERSPAQGR